MCLSCESNKGDRGQAWCASQGPYIDVRLVISLHPILPGLKPSHGLSLKDVGYL